MPRSANTSPACDGCSACDRRRLRGRDADRRSDERSAPRCQWHYREVAAVADCAVSDRVANQALRLDVALRGNRPRSACGPRSPDCLPDSGLSFRRFDPAIRVASVFVATSRCPSARFSDANVSTWFHLHTVTTSADGVVTNGTARKHSSPMSPSVSTCCLLPESAPSTRARRPHLLDESRCEASNRPTRILCQPCWWHNADRLGAISMSACGERCCASR